MLYLLYFTIFFRLSVTAHSFILLSYCRFQLRMNARRKKTLSDIFKFQTKLKLIISSRASEKFKFKFNLSHGTVNHVQRSMMQHTKTNSYSGKYSWGQDGGQT